MGERGQHFDDPLALVGAERPDRVERPLSLLVVVTGGVVSGALCQAP